MANYREQTATDLEVLTTCSSCVALPTIVTTSVSNETGTAADSGGETITDGGGTVSQKGIQWSADNFATQMGATAVGAGTASFASSITGLTVNSTYYVRAFATNEIGTAFGAIIQFVSAVSFTCGAATISGNAGVQDTNINLDSSGGLLAFLLYASSVPDKLEIIHGNPSNGTKVSTSGVSATGNSGPFDNTYGTEPSNLIPSKPQAIANAQFIGDDIQSPWTVTRLTEFNTATGYTVVNLNPGGSGNPTYQQVIWWEYTTADFQSNPIATVRITGTANTAWKVFRLCCPDNNCT